MSPSKKPAGGARNGAKPPANAGLPARPRRAKAAGPAPAPEPVPVHNEIQAIRDEREAAVRELTDLAGRLAETVRHAQEQLADVVRQAREAYRDLEELRRSITEARREAAGPPVAAAHDGPLLPVKEEISIPPAVREVGRGELGVAVGNGVVVAEAFPDSPAAAAGLTRGDVIDSVNGRPVRGAAQLREAVQQVADGGEVVLVVYRAGELHQITARLPAPTDESEGRNRFGLTVGPGVVVAEVRPDSPAARAGIQSGDVIDELNGTELVSGEQLRDVVTHLAAGADVVLRVTRAGEVREVPIRFDPTGG